MTPQLDSVNLLKAGKPEDREEQEWASTVTRNKDHLEIVIAKGIFSKEQVKELHV